MRHELVCLRPATPPVCAVRSVALPTLRRDEVLVRVEATAVNPIDAKRASGYGQRLLGLKGAATFPLVLGNDLAGTVQALGSGVYGLQPGQAVYGLVPTGKRGGAHASHVAVPQTLLRPAPTGMSVADLAVLPYSFTTMWLAVRATGLHANHARGKRVLVHGAAGGLGRLALQWLAPWGCELTAICSAETAAECHALGAQHTVVRGPLAIQGLSSDFDVVLNFASWDDELALASRLGSSALGHATTVHPLLDNFDRLGWIGGALTCRREARAIRSAVRQRATGASYHWTVFKPQTEALDALDRALREHRLFLPVGLDVGLAQADAAFAHVSAGQAGRALLLP